MKAHDLQRRRVGVFMPRMGKTRSLAAIALCALLALAAPVSASEPAGTVGGDTYSVTRYDAFGRVEYEVSPDVPRFGFTGYLRGPESDLFYAEQRWYDARTGRFLSEDPIWGDPQTPLSLHRYLYAYANPTVYVDPDGRWPLARDLMGRKDFAKDLDEAGYGVMASELAQRRSLQLAGMRVRAGQGGVLSIGAAATALPAARVVGSIGRAVWKAVAATHAEIKAVGLTNAILANPHTVSVASGELAVAGAAIASGADTPLSMAGSAARRGATQLAGRTDDAAPLLRPQSSRTAYAITESTSTASVELQPLSVETGPYREMAQRRDIPGQAHHLNQNAIYRDVIPTSDGVAVKLEGDAFRQPGTPHYQVHQYQEALLDQFRPGGARYPEVPTNLEVNRSTLDALQRAGYSREDSMELLRAAIRNRVEHGVLGGELIPWVPRRINQVPDE